MKRRVFITLMLITVVHAGVLHGNYIQRESVEGISHQVAYCAYYPEKIPTITLIPPTNIPF